jgi:hypothetical protein
MATEKIFHQTGTLLIPAERSSNACANAKGFVNKSFRKYFLFEVSENGQ